MTVSSVFGCNDPVVLASALLHDTIEDTTTDFEDILDRFGAQIAENVAALTKNMALPEELREETYDAQLLKANWQVKLIKLADVYDNLHDIAEFPEARREKAKSEAIDKCERAIAIARSKPATPLVAQAAKIVESFMRGV
jgi:guanosine-3',5'-bis(diphosphate) 3'-pyrophosphohydrolase